LEAVLFVHCDGQRRSDADFLVQNMMLTMAQYNKFEQFIDDIAQF
jgi:hypothetical protein